jgi:hypothetical protein
MLTIGFTNIYYTLWEVSEPYETPIFYKGVKVGSNTKQHLCYIQNLSMDLDEAKVI